MNVKRLSTQNLTIKMVRNAHKPRKSSAVRVCFIKVAQGNALDISIHYSQSSWICKLSTHLGICISLFLWTLSKALRSLWLSPFHKWWYWETGKASDLLAVIEPRWGAKIQNPGNCIPKLYSGCTLDGWSQVIPSTGHSGGEDEERVIAMKMKHLQVVFSFSFIERVGKNSSCFFLRNTDSVYEDIFYNLNLATASSCS